MRLLYRILAHPFQKGFFEGGGENKKMYSWNIHIFSLTFSSAISGCSVGLQNVVYESQFAQPKLIMLNKLQHIIVYFFDF